MKEIRHAMGWYAAAIIALLLPTTACAARYPDGKGDVGTVSVTGVRTRLTSYDWGVIPPKLLDGGGSGGSEIGNKGNPDGKKNPKKDDCNKAGNPIIYSTGNKIELDLENSGRIDYSAVQSVH